MQKKLLIANKYVFIQVRTSSKRLFGKCLFKIKGKEAILVLFNRIKSNSYKTIILTSNDKSDDYLVKILKKMLLRTKKETPETLILLSLNISGLVKAALL